MENPSKPAVPPAEPPDLTVFTVNIDGTVYRCPVSPAALYMLASRQPGPRDQIDAYLELKQAVHEAVGRLLAQGDKVPAVLEPEHFRIRVAYADSGYAESGYAA